MNSPLTVGWIIGSQIDGIGWFNRLFRRPSYQHGGTSLVRYTWVSEYINSHPELNLKYELYQPKKKYDALLFLKSMGDRCLKLIHDQKKQGVISLFDANVNYYEINGNGYYAGMLPTDQQQKDAIEITKTSDAIIADSRFIESKCQQYNNNVKHIPDNVRMELAPEQTRWKIENKKIPLLWSGEAVKLFELLSIEDVLLHYAKNIELILITNSQDAIERWRPEVRLKFKSMLEKVPHRFIEYKSIDQLFSVYAEGGVAISPRFLDNSYNYGHTEWKITLAMACSRMVLCSPVPSYVDVSDKSASKGIRICRDPDNWKEALDSIFSGQIDLDEEESAARKTVVNHYSTSVISQMHAKFLHDIIAKYS